MGHWVLGVLGIGYSVFLGLVEGCRDFGIPERAVDFQFRAQALRLMDLQFRVEGFGTFE